MTALILLKDFLETQIEIWHPIVGFPDYEASNLGRIRSWRRQGRYSGRDSKSRILKQTPNKVSGRLMVNLRQDNVSRAKQVCRLVAITFLPNPQNLPEVNHKTGIPADNRVGVLEWSTGKDNQEHSKRYGLAACGERSGAAKVTNDDVREIRRLCASGMSQREAGERFGLKQAAVSSMCRRETWYLVD